MSFSFHRNSSKSKDKAKVDEPMLDVTSGGGASSTSRPATPSGTQKPKNKFKFWSSRPKSVSEQSLPPAPDQNQQAEETRVPAPPQPFIVAPMETPFKGGPDDRAYEVEIYANGVTAVTCLQKLAGLTGPGTPNPLPIILEALVGVLTQLQKMVKNDGDWKTLFLLIAEHLDTFNNQLRLLALAEVTPDPESALHKPIVQYSATLRQLTVKVITDAGFDPSAEHENSDWSQLKMFIKQFMQAGEVQEQIEEYRNELIKAMDLLLRGLALFSAVKGEETNIVVKRVDTKLDEVHMAVQKISGKLASGLVIGSGVFAKSLPTVSPYFVGREPELDLMKTHLVKSTHSGQKVFAITGMGGSGKTQLVSYFLQETNKEQTLFTHVIFIDASSEPTLKTDLQSWIQSLGFNHEKDDWNNAISFLVSGIPDGRWVLIFDNADDPNLRLKKYFPGCARGTILITSRNRGVGSLTNTHHLELGKMDAGDALAALEKAAHRQIPNPSKEMDDAKILMEKLGYLPLALVHAGSYCHQQSSIVDGKAYDFTVSRYLALFNKRRDALLGSKTMFIQEEYERGVYATLDLSYEVLQEASRQFLRIISHFQYSDIPLAMFQAAAQIEFQNLEIFLPRPDEHSLVKSQLTELFCLDGEFDEFQLLELIRDLQSFSLVLRSEDSLRMHPLVQAWARDMKLAETQDYQGMATQILSSCRQNSNVHIYRYLLPHIKERLAKKEGDDLHIDDKVAFGRILQGTGSHTLAEPIFRKAIAEYDEEKTDFLDIVSYLADGIRNQGRWEDAKRLQEEVLEKRKKILGADHLDSLAAAADLADTYGYLGRWKDAEEMQEEVLQKLNKIQGPDHPASMNAASSLAATYRDQGRWDNAARLEEELLEKRRRTLGADHTASIRAASHLATTYRNQGRLKEAEALEEDVLKRFKRIMGDDHHNSIYATANLAETYRVQGRWEDAEKLQVDVLEKMKRVRGADHPHNMNAANCLATTYYLQGRWDEAEVLLKEILEKRTRILGTDHPDTIHAAHHLSRVYNGQGRHKEAEKLLEEVRERQNRIIGADHPESMEAAVVLATIYNDQGRWNEAEKLGEEVLKKRNKLLGADHPKSISAAGGLAATYHKQGRWGDAQKLQEDVLEKRNRIIGADHPDSIVAAAALAMTYESQGKFNDAENILDSVADKSVKVLGAQHPSTQQLVRQMVNLCKKLEKQDKAGEMEKYLI